MLTGIHVYLLMFYISASNIDPLFEPWPKMFATHTECEDVLKEELPKMSKILADDPKKVVAGECIRLPDAVF